jgi:hypothetical protein
LPRAAFAAIGAPDLAALRLRPTLDVEEVDLGLSAPKMRPDSPFTSRIARNTFRLSSDCLGCCSSCPRKFPAILRRCALLMRTPRHIRDRFTYSA